MRQLLCDTHPLKHLDCFRGISSLGLSEEIFFFSILLEIDDKQGGGSISEDLQGRQQDEVECEQYI